MRRFAFTALSALLAWTAAPSTGTAQSQQEVAEARAAFERGESLFSEQNYALALEAFERSYDLLEGHPRQHLVLFNVARCQEELGRLADAVETFERYLRQGGADEDNAEETRRRIDELDRRLELSREDDREDETAPPRDEGPSGLLFAGIGLEAVGGLAAIATVVTSVLAHGIYGKLKDRCMPVDNCPPGSASDISNGRALAWSSAILLPVSVAAVGAGTVLIILDAIGATDGDEDHAALQLLPTLGGAQLRGRF